MLFSCFRPRNLWALWDDPRLGFQTSFSRRHLCCLKRSEWALLRPRSGCFAVFFVLIRARPDMGISILGVENPLVRLDFKASCFAKIALVLCLLAFGRHSGACFVCALFSFFCDFVFFLFSCKDYSGSFGLIVLLTVQFSTTSGIVL